MPPLSVSRRRLFEGAASFGLGAVVPAPAVASIVPGAPPRWLPLIETHVAGTAYYEAARVRDSLHPGDALVLKREPSNPHDARAIEVFTAQGVKLGYVPRVRNPPFAALMDDGQALRATVAAVHPPGWNAIRFTIALRVPAG
ncbi:HIRAN domain-containing protein [Roseospira navarrensis]|uniref:DNA-binding protein n=1 Tax=Roseospira navarrensis TaxID=140058 RepID=A0A7X1ZF53_9PROT|nr:HIRAN domain-containing protein [Roseospira navarrensis]MQX37439.1 DNA-binding protein [Roseospira navarrensis]